MEKLANDLIVLVRAGVAGNPDTPSHILVQLAEHSSLDIRLAVAQNPNTPLSVLEGLQNDLDNNISFWAKTQLKTNSA